MNGNITIEDCQDYVAEGPCDREGVYGGDDSWSLKNLSIAEIRIPAGVTVKKHYHLESEETYHIVSGSGLMHLDGEEQPIEPGQAVAIHPRQWHTIHNRPKLIW